MSVMSVGDWANSYGVVYSYVGVPDDEFEYTLNSSHCFGLKIVPSAIVFTALIDVNNPWKDLT